MTTLAHGISPALLQSLGWTLLLGRGTGQDRDRIGRHDELRLHVIAPALDRGLALRADDQHRDALGATHRLRIHAQGEAGHARWLGSLLYQPQQRLHPERRLLSDD